MPNESWRFGRAEGDLLFHFSSGWDTNGGGDLYDYRLVESVLDLRGAAEAPEDQLMLSRQAVSPVYGRMLNWGRFGAARARVARARDRPGEHRHRHDDRQPRASLRPRARRRGGPGGGGREGRHAAGPSRLRRGGAGHRPGFGGRRSALCGAGARGSQRQRGSAASPTWTPPSSSALGRRSGAASISSDGSSCRCRPASGTGERPCRWATAAVWFCPRDTVRVAGLAAGALSLSDLALGVREASARWEPTPRRHGAADAVRSFP